MAIGDVVFVKGQGGLGRPLQGEDYISSLLFYTANGNLPSGWTTSNRIKALYSVADAETNGIKADYSDATAATLTYLISTKGNTGDTINLTYTGINAQVFNTGTYTVGSSETTIALQGAAWAAKINAGTYIHGCTATFATATLTVTLPKSQGIFANSGTPAAITLTGAFVGTLTQPSGGTASKQAVWHYHIAEYFRIQPKGVLYVGFFAVPNSYTFSEITTIQNYSGGKVRQIAVYKDSAAYTSADLTAIHTEIVTNCDANHKPLSAIYAADMSAVTDFTALTDLNTLSANKASCIVSQDGAALGAYLYKHAGKSITTLGAALGAVSLAAVSDNIGWVDKFNISNGTECDTPALANGTLLSTLSQNAIDAIDNLHYVFLVNRVGRSGSFFNNSYTAIVQTSDYARIENNRTIDKAIRGVYASLVGSINSKVIFNADGTMTDTTIAYLTTQAELNLRQMVRDVELSDFAVTINPQQNVLQTGKIIVAVQLLPIGVAEKIQVNIGFTTSLA